MIFKKSKTAQAFPRPTKCLSNGKQPLPLFKQAFVRFKLTSVGGRRRRQVDNADSALFQGFAERLAKIEIGFFRSDKNPLYLGIFYKFGNIVKNNVFNVGIERPPFYIAGTINVRQGKAVF